jgi:hypothetical protein
LRYVGHRAGVICVNYLAGSRSQNESKYPHIVELVVADNELDVIELPDDGLSKVAKNSGGAWTESR